MWCAVGEQVIGTSGEWEAEGVDVCAWGCCGTPDVVGVWGGGVIVIESEEMPEGPPVVMSESPAKGLDSRRTFSSSRFFRQAAFGFKFLSRGAGDFIQP